MAEVLGRPPTGDNSAELARRRKADRARNKSIATQRSKMQQRIAQLNKQLRRAKSSKLKGSAKRKQVAQIQKRISAAKKALARLPKPSGSSTSRSARVASARPTNWDQGAIIDEAYLRTLSRLPSREESQAAEAFFKDSTTPQESVEGLLWALINTKEFIVNH